MTPAESRPDTGRPRSADDLARERVVRILDHLGRHGAPIRASDGRRPERRLERARIRAEQVADDAGRGEMLDEAREVVIDAYTARLAGAGLWTSFVATSVPYSAQDRAESQAAILDLVTAAVTEDLLEASAVRLLRDDGQAILDLPTLVTEPGSGDGTAGNAVVNAYRDSPTSRRVLNGIGALALAGLVFLIVAGATEEFMLALSLALGVVVLLALSVYGPGWWERRGQTR